MKKKNLIFFYIFMASLLFASGAKDVPEWGTVESFNINVEKQLGHEIEKYEQVIVDATYLYYYGKCEENWTLEKWDIAITKAVNMCNNPVAVAAAKTGVFGEKLLQTLVVTTEDAISGFNNWIENGSEKYKEKYNP
ncbi:MAG: hypothetical protein E7062_10795 [Spirochaetaceae bacterium]|nr:hypothetical protein [Spirochaetaceae bacterium]